MYSCFLLSFCFEIKRKKTNGSILEQNVRQFVLFHIKEQLVLFNIIKIKMSKFIFVIIIFLSTPIEKSQMAVGEKRRTFTGRSEGALLGHYLFLAETAYISNTPAFFILTTTNELECKCACSANKQCLAMTYRLSDSTCSLYANDPCDTRNWQTNFDLNFYINVKRLKYRIFEKPVQDEPLKRLSASSLCGSMNVFNSERRWLYAVKISGQSNVNFQGLNFDNAPNQVAPSPWYTTPFENIWNSMLMQQW
jgi:hypothetical protein